MDVADGAHIDRAGYRLLVLDARQHHHSGCRIPLTKISKHRKAVHVGQIEIKQHQVKPRVRAGKTYCRRGVRRRKHFTSRIDLGEDVPQRLANQRVIVNDKNFQ